MVRYVYQGNPRDQHGHHGRAVGAAPDRLTPPAARLRRLGATGRALQAYRRWWEGMGDDQQRRAALGILGLLPDDELAAQVADVDAMHDWPSGQIDTWARKQANRPLAAAVAAAVEQGRDSPREGLLKKLAAIR